MDVQINSGELRHRVSFLNPAVTADTKGDVAAATPFSTVWAKVSTMSGSELYRSQQFTTEANHIIVLRYLAGLSSSMSVKFGTRVFEILYIDDVDERHIKHVIYAKELDQ